MRARRESPQSRAVSHHSRVLDTLLRGGWGGASGLRSGAGAGGVLKVAARDSPRLPTRAPSRQSTSLDGGILAGRRDHICLSQQAPAPYRELSLTNDFHASDWNTLLSDTAGP